MPLKKSPSEGNPAFSSMPEGRQPRILFTVAEANATLPLVRVIVADLSDLSRSVVDRQQRISRLSAGENTSEGDPYREELSQMECDLQRDAEKLGHYVGELRELGVEPKGAMEGLVDFPALHEGRLVYLCWKLNEPEVLYWHELDGGFVGRQPVASLNNA